ncbi:type I phosphomannose isomerase catalytic subunit [Limisphaera sp. VF-2]|jgi:mannose-6-phosphate isomerase|uniref:type I phosphomannose isomerase catalytic subunit n=1 Tax=Limisphaera sp. VF-2 TaxID=3400418 RepID=UPI001752FF70
MFYPLVFEPRFKERVWGGRRLETLYGKRLLSGRPVGESWEITDRPEDVSVIANGSWAGRDLRWLMEAHREALLGNLAPAAGDRFPWLVKILDARELLSVQVHPPAEVARRLGGEPKTELWYITEAERGAEIYTGLRRGVTREEFERRLREGTVADCIHRFAVRAGDAVFLPSGRIHALGAGLVLFEIQQNSDTTYRVYDWGRRGLDGRPRPLHVPEALASVDFQDFEPGPLPERWEARDGGRRRPLVEHELFCVEVWRWNRSTQLEWGGGGCRVLGCVAGRLVLEGGNEAVDLRPGRFCLLPAALESVRLAVDSAAEVLVVLPGVPGKGA